MVANIVSEEDKKAVAFPFKQSFVFTALKRSSLPENSRRFPFWEPVCNLFLSGCFSFCVVVGETESVKLNFCIFWNASMPVSYRYSGEINQYNTDTILDLILMHYWTAEYSRLLYILGLFCNIFFFNQYCSIVYCRFQYSAYHLQYHSVHFHVKNWQGHIL